MDKRKISIRWAAGPDDLRGAFALYEKAGFAVESETFEEAGIQHVWMAQRLTEGDSTDG
jgi:hypothetical protein